MATSISRPRLLLIGAVTLAAVTVVLLLPPIPQSNAYHDFADQRPLLGVPNALNVLSNFPFLIVGMLGLWFVARARAGDSRGCFIESAERWPYVVFFLGVALTSLGSAYYHLSPGNETLVWDRLPMTIAFTSFLAATISERLSTKAGLRMLAPLIVVGISSVIYWRWSESGGAGDLRPYALVQFYSILAIVLMSLLFPARYTRTGDLLGAVIGYALAKGFESLDREIFALGHVVSGHALKHVAAAFSVLWILKMLRRREPAQLEAG